MLSNSSAQPSSTASGRNREVYDVDPAVTDAERAEWGLPPLAEAVARAGELNRPPTPPTPPVAPGSKP